jgi:histone demethylase JARID1
VEKTHLDLHSLHRTVAEEGGFENCVQTKKWLKVASKMFRKLNPNEITSPTDFHYGYLTLFFFLTHFAANSISKATVSKQLRVHYEKLLYPYDIFLIGASGEAKPETGNIHQANNSSSHTPVKRSMTPDTDERKSMDSYCLSDRNESTNVSDNDTRPSSCVGSPATKATHRMSRRSTSQRNTCSPSPTASSSFSRLLRRNQALSEQSQNTPSACPSPTASNTAATSPASTLHNLLLSTGKQIAACHLCSESDRTRRILQCARCEKYVHMTCLFPSLSMVPKTNWHCANCIEQMLPQMPQPYTNEFGFVESRRKYSLAEFGLLANDFKNNYFGELQTVGIALSTVEKEFWRLVASIEDTVTVEYGADLHTNQVGSGFATRKSSIIRDTNQIDSEPKENTDQNSDLISQMELKCKNNPLYSNQMSDVYVDHPWNLNRLPLLDGSLFRYVNGNINGMIVPWIYVGMCFSTFCWHNEDHWTYSINYLHFGDAKTWYGVPGESAPKFERAMEAIAPELFAAQPDLLHQLVTTCNPALLKSYDVPIYRIDQLPGEFVITFPRAYHAGFNQGFNLAEAVNFAPIDWLALGRRSVRDYARLRRYPVFSHEELLFRMAQDDSLPAHHVQELFVELLHVVRAERDQRRSLLDLGVHRSQHVPFDQLPDEQRQCKHCRSTCYLSALVCDCQPADAPLSQVCLEHVAHLCTDCNPERWTMRHTYKLDQLCLVLKKLHDRVAQYESWAFEVASSLKLALNELQSSFEQMAKEEMEVKETSDKLHQDLLQQKVIPTNLLYKRLMSLESEIDKPIDVKVEPETLESLIRSGKELHVPPTDRFWIALIKSFASTTECSDRLANLRQLLNKDSFGTGERLPIDEVRDLLQMALFSPSDDNHFLLERAYNDVHELQHRLRELTEANLATESIDLDCVKQLINRLRFVDVDRDLRRLIDQKPHLSHLLH